MTPKNLNFGEALKFLNAGRKLAREGWNGSNLHVELTCGKTHEDWTDLEPFFVLYTPARDVYNVWVPSTSDILAADWMVV